MFDDSVPIIHNTIFCQLCQIYRLTLTFSVDSFRLQIEASFRLQIEAKVV